MDGGGGPPPLRTKRTRGCRQEMGTLLANGVASFSGRSVRSSCCACTAIFSATSLKSKVGRHPRRCHGHSPHRESRRDACESSRPFRRRPRTASVHSKGVHGRCHGVPGADSGYCSSLTSTAMVSPTTATYVSDSAFVRLVSNSNGERGTRPRNVATEPSAPPSTGTSKPSRQQRPNWEVGTQSPTSSWCTPQLHPLRRTRRVRMACMGPCRNFWTLDALRPLHRREPLQPPLRATAWPLGARLSGDRGNARRAVKPVQPDCDRSRSHDHLQLRSSPLEAAGNQPSTLIRNAHEFKCFPDAQPETWHDQRREQSRPHRFGQRHHQRTDRRNPWHRCQPHLICGRRLRRLVDDRSEGLRKMGALASAAGTGATADLLRSSFLLRPKRSGILNQR